MQRSNKKIIYFGHTDSAYLDNDSYNVLQATAWIPLLDTNEKNGCMEVSIFLNFRIDVKTILV